MQIQELLERNNTLTAKKIAEWLNMTQPRICQILDPLKLHPTIQRDILISQDKRLYDLGEYDLPHHQRTSLGKADRDVEYSL